MLIEIRYVPPLRRWHGVLAARLSAGGRAVRFASVEDPEGVARRRAVDRLLAVERRLYGKTPALFAPFVLPTVAVPLAADIVLVLDGKPPADLSCIRPLFDGVPGGNALLGVLLDGRAPAITVEGRRAGREADGADRGPAGWLALAAGLPAIEDRHVLARSLDDLLPRLATLLVQAVDAWASPPARAAATSGPVPSRHGSAARLLARGVADRITNRLGALGGRAPHWQIAFRPAVAGADGIEPRWSGGDYRLLANERGRLRSDPFVFSHAGRRCIFFEDLAREDGKGVIARVEVGPDGSLSPVHRVLEHAVHLSYPLVLRHHDVVYMLPEMSAGRRLQLFRADPFPDRWVADRVLLDDTAVSDATPVFHEGMWWIFATTTDDGGSSWDQLGLFHAPDLLGPWTPHAGNPVLIDAGSARPAGAMWHEGGVLMRVAQDCRTGYGEGLAICRVDRLDAGGFAQTVLSRIGAPAGSRAHGVHTLNRDDSLEVFDLKYR